MLRFENLEDFIEIGLVTRETGDLPSHGDVYVTIRVSSAGFTGHNDLWVLDPVFRYFCRSLVTLERDRRGEAISPNELRLVVRSIDSCGHMGVGGYTGYEVQRDFRHWHSVQFGFEFDPSQLIKATNMDWIRAVASRE